MTSGMAHLAAILVFAVAQFVSVAHAEEHHDEQSTHKNCAICFLAIADDDLDTPARCFDLVDNSSLASRVAIPATQFVATKKDSPSIIRGPPQN